MKKPLLIVLAGLPAAGKSSFAHRLGLLLDEAREIRTMVIASDTVRDEFPALREGFIPDLEPIVRKITLDRVKASLGEGLNVIHDDLNYYRSMRFELVALSREIEVPHALIHIDTPTPTCLEWNAARGRKIPDSVITKDAARFDRPGEDPWDEPYARLNVAELDEAKWKKLVDGLVKRAETFHPWIPKEKTAHSPTRAEEIDLLSRKVVGELFRSFKPKVDGKIISKIRLELVDRSHEEEQSDRDAETLFRKELGKLFLSQ